MYTPRTSLGDLNTAELFVAFSLRLWLLPHCHPGRRYPDWRDGLVRAKIDAAGISGFDTLCRIVATAAPGPLKVRALLCERLGTEEIGVLQALGALQHEQVTAATAILRRTCPPAATHRAILPASDFAKALQSQRLWIVRPTYC